MTIFAKRHYEAIALVCQQSRANIASKHNLTIELNLADMFKADNPRFDRNRFLFACLPGSNVKAKTAYLRVAS